MTADFVGKRAFRKKGNGCCAAGGPSAGRLLRSKGACRQARKERRSHLRHSAFDLKMEPTHAKAMKQSNNASRQILFLACRPGPLAA
jgi:hypothetical protein